MEEDAANRAADPLQAQVKKLVRFALACEYSRTPIRRTDIGAKVMGDGGGGWGRGAFREVFAGAQAVLQKRFGMEMVELPVRDKVTIGQRRGESRHLSRHCKLKLTMPPSPAAQRADRTAATSKSWILTTTLPAAYRIPAILPPPRISSATADATYTALYTFLISLVTIAGGSLPEARLGRFLRRTNADTYTPIDRTDRLLARMCRDGYLVRAREVEGGEEVVEYLVGPRGKVEVGIGGVARMMGMVYGFGPDVLEESHGQEQTRLGDEDGEGNDQRAEFCARLRRTLGIVEGSTGAAANEAQTEME